VIPSFGNASAALYNGTDVTPFILSSQANGQPGSMSKFFSQNQNTYTTTSEFALLVDPDRTYANVLI
jgi:hypothetical protein